MSEDFTTTGRPVPGPTPPHLETGVYSVDALTEDERVAFEAALAQDDALAEEAAGLQATAAQLGLAAAETPPAEMRARVLAEVDRTRQDLSDATSRRGDAVVDMAEERRQRRNARVLGAAAAVLAVLALSLAVYAGALRQQNQDLSSARAQVTRILTAPDAHTVTSGLQGQEGRGAVVVSEQLGAAVFVAEDLQPLPSGSTYQLWYLAEDGSARSAGTFEPAGSGVTAVTLTGPPDGAAQVGLSVEPAGGSAQPTTSPVMAVPLA